MAWRYKDPNRFLPGVPARDLTDAEMDAAEGMYPGLKDVDPPLYEYSGDSAHPAIAKRIAAVAEASASGAGPDEARAEEPEPEEPTPAWPNVPPVPGAPGGPAVVSGTVPAGSASTSESAVTGGVSAGNLAAGDDDKGKSKD